MLSKTLVHGLAGGALSRAQGGSFRSGFLGSAFAQATGNVIGKIRSAAGRVVAAAILGGTAAKLGGGKFANGAVSGAFSRALNDELHRRREIAKVAIQRELDSVRRKAEQVTRTIGEVSSGLGDGVASVFTGAARSIRYLGRSFGAYGSDEMRLANLEGHAMDSAIGFAIENPSIIADGAGMAIDMAVENAGPYSVARVVGRVTTGFVLAPLGGLAAIGDVTFGIEQGRISLADTMRSAFYGNQ